MAFVKSAGALNQRITFQRQTINVDDVGNHINTWVDYFSCWACVSTSKLKVTEKDEAANTLEQERLDFTVRYCPQTVEVRSTEYRIIFRGRIYDIDSIDQAEYKKDQLKFSAYLVRR